MQLDGPDLEELLLRARQQYGSGLRIVAADKVRSGGIGGFFTREHYELTVETDDPTSAQDAVRGSAQGAASSAPEPTSVPEPTSALVDIESSAHRPVSLLDLAEAISDRETFEPRAHVGPPPSELKAVHAPTPGALSGSVSNGPAVSTEGASFASILAGLTESVAEPLPATTAARGRTSYDQLSADGDHDGSADRESFVTARPPLVEPGARRVDLRPARRSAAPEVTLSSLRDLGVPSALLPHGLPHGHDGDLLAALVLALRALPPVPELPRGAGEVLAVVGDGAAAWEAALQLVASAGLDERAVAFVTAGNAPPKVPPARRVTSLDQLEVRLDRWRKRAGLTVVAVDAPMTPRAADTTRGVLDMLGAGAVWLVVPATRKTADVADWADRLGAGHALVVTDVDASRDPASVLRLGIPVAWLDGRPATVGAWAGLLVERLVEAA